MTYIITGASGFIGYNLADYLLKKSFRVIALVNENSNLIKINSLPGIETIKYSNNLNEVKPQLNSIDASCFIHCAWMGVTGAERNDIKQLYNNIPFALSTMQLAHDLNCVQWLGLGSQAEYGAINEKVTEAQKENPSSAYAHAKYLIYQSMKAMANFSKVKYTWVRVFSLYGPNDNSNNFIPYLISSFSSKTSPSITSCEQKWDYLFVMDAVEALYLLTEKRAEGLFNLGSGEVIVLKNVVEELKAQMNVMDEILYGNKTTSIALYHLEADITKLNETIHWKPTTTLKIGLSKTINFYTQ